MTQDFDSNQGTIDFHSFKECSIDASTNALFKIVKNNILDKGYSSVMNGSYNYVVSRLHEYYPKIWYLYYMTF